MTSMSVTHRAKQKLLRLLKDEKNDKQIFTSSLKNNDNALPSSITYIKIRSKYLKRIQEIHPDKLSSNNDKQRHKKNVNYSKDFIHKRFIELQSAWNEYEKLFKLTESNTKQKTGHNINEEEDGDGMDNFTMFGVGCSFSDTPEERENRRRITDEACRGWFTSGLIPERSDSSSSFTSPSMSKSISRISLIDDDMFIEEQDSVSDCSSSISIDSNGDNIK